MGDKMGGSEIFRKKLRGGGLEKDLNHSHYID